MMMRAVRSARESLSGMPCDVVAEQENLTHQAACLVERGRHGMMD